MMKTWIIVGVILIGVSVGVIIGVNKMMDSDDVQKSVQTSKPEINNSNETTESQEQTNEMNEVTYDLKLKESPRESEIIQLMHNMTHQKVKADKKWGATPMIPDTINQIYEVISNSDFSRKEDLLAIAERWKNGDFSRVDDDHNYFWNYQNGTVGKARGILSEEEERKYIIKKFGEEYLPK